MTTWPGGRAAYALLVAEFGPTFGEYLLWNFTCYPCSYYVAWQQAHALVGASKAGVFKGYYAAQQAKQEAAMLAGAAA